MLGFDIVGNGREKVITCHGWFGDHNTFSAMWDAINLDAFTFLNVAYRGYGLSREISGTYSMDETAADILEVADAQGWEKFNLVGHSMGGMVVQRILANAPDRVKKIVAITPVPASGVPFDDAGWNLFHGAVESLDNRKAIIDRSTGQRLTQTWIEKMANYSVETSTRKAFGGNLDAWVKTDFHKEIEGNPVPIKVIIGEHDPDLSEEAMKATFLSWYPNAKFEAFANAGHYPMNETPLALASSIERFLLN